MKGARLVVLSDVTTPFEEAATVVGPQKGAAPDAVGRLTDHLHRLTAGFPRDPRGLPRSGAAGGLAGGLWAFSDAELTSGIDAVMDAASVDDASPRAAVVVTGEGRLNDQSMRGRVVSGVVRRAVGRPVYVCAGYIAPGPCRAGGRLPRGAGHARSGGPRASGRAHHPHARRSAPRRSEHGATA
ncbi:glycerate kinase [Geodermatophilus sp. URMC 63]